jgi:hypothetical protein
MAIFELFRLNGLFDEKFQVRRGSIAKAQHGIAAEDRVAVVKWAIS